MLTDAGGWEDRRGRPQEAHIDQTLRAFDRSWCATEHLGALGGRWTQERDVGRATSTLRTGRRPYERGAQGDRDGADSRRPLGARVRHSPAVARARPHRGALRHERRLRAVRKGLLREPGRARVGQRDGRASGRALLRRSRETLERYPHKDVAVVTHGTVITLFVALLSRFDQGYSTCSEYTGTLCLGQKAEGARRPSLLYGLRRTWTKGPSSASIHNLKTTVS
jgi:hypothetical protein